MLSTLLTQFRQRHPQGSLTSDLLTIHDGLYVVRVCAAVEGSILACGLGANTSLELAEDLATTRALERLGVAPLSSSAPAAIAPPSPVDEAVGFDVALSSPAPPALTPPVKASSPPPLTLVKPPVEPPVEPADEPPADDLDPPLTYSELELAAEDLPMSPVPPSTRPPSRPSPPKENPPIHLDEAALAPIDLSDIIAQTDVELQRLGWGVAQGREFLEKTYGKRSRHDLTDDELLEFLLFLETQSPLPTP